MRFACLLVAAGLALALPACGDDDFGAGADGPSVSQDFAMTMNADLGPDLLPPVDLAHD